MNSLLKIWLLHISSMLSLSERAWINKYLLQVWYEKMWITYVRERAKKFLMVIDAFEAHFTTNFQQQC